MGNATGKMQDYSHKRILPCWTLTVFLLVGTIVKTLLLTVSHASASFHWTAGSHATILDPSLPQLAPLLSKNLPLSFRMRRQIGGDPFRSIFKAPCFGRFGFFEDPFSCSHYHHCMTNGTHIRRTCMPPLQFSEERQMCAEPGTVDCPDLPDFWLAAGAAAAVSGSAGSAPSAPHSPSPPSHPNAIHNTPNHMAPFSAASSNNPFLARGPTFNAPSQPPASVHSLVSPFHHRGESNHLSASAADGPSPAGSATMTDRDPMLSPSRSAVQLTNDPGYITTYNNRRHHAASPNGVRHVSPMIAAPNGVQPGNVLSTGGHLQMLPGTPHHSSWDAQSRAPAHRRYPSSQNAPVVHHSQSGSYSDFNNPSSSSSAASLLHAQLAQHNNANGASDPSHSPAASNAAPLGALDLLYGPQSKMPETPPDSVLERLGMHDANVNTQQVIQAALAGKGPVDPLHKILSNLMRGPEHTSGNHAAERGSGAGATNSETICAPQQRGFFADFEHDCKGYYFCSPFGDRADFRCPVGRFYSEKTVSCETLENSSCATPTPVISPPLDGSAPQFGIPYSHATPDAASEFGSHLSQQQQVASGASSGNKAIVMRGGLQPSAGMYHQPYPQTPAVYNSDISAGQGLDAHLLAHLRSNQPAPAPNGQPDQGPAVPSNGQWPSNPAPPAMNYPGYPYPMLPPPMPGGYGPFNSHYPNAVETKKVNAMPIKDAPLSDTPSDSPSDLPSDVSPVPEPSTSATVFGALESKLRSSWKSLAGISVDTEPVPPVDVASPVNTTLATIRPKTVPAVTTTLTSIPALNSTEEMMAAESVDTANSIVVPMASSMSKAFDNARYMQAQAAARSAALKAFRSAKYVDRKRTPNLKLLDELSGITTA
ncbi:hypothetical protein RvY_14194 [Ramazzottius varieornatus]|uniref:Chitin-binding type-2 domain-containing protein n=1 Tax=Ramazzottius varieornatus TaxID=947166 RepID=A0A1D1VVK2_RAMVA|nr:hypothetical protein RvY_14194 [Ramazzottius varieornatus]